MVVVVIVPKKNNKAFCAPKRKMDWLCEPGMREMAIVMKWRVIEENGERRHAKPTPNELGKGQEEEEVVLVPKNIIISSSVLRKPR
jgi:hypothetical protein